MYLVIHDQMHLSVMISMYKSLVSLSLIAQEKTLAPALKSGAMSNDTNLSNPL